MSYSNWPIRSKDRSRLEEFLTKLTEGLGRKLSYVDVAELIFNHSESIVDAIVTAESVTNNSQSPERVKA